MERVRIFGGSRSPCGRGAWAVGLRVGRTTAETTLVILRFDLATETISGTLEDELGDERPFWGWLELSGALEELSGAEARRVDAPRIPERESEK